MGCYYSIIWKGEDGTLSIPFNFSGYSNVTVAIKTYGIPQVVFEEGEFTIEDGFINVPYDENDFDLLPNGVLRYIVDFQVDGYDGVLSNNLNAVLKTPESYSAQTADEIWQDGYDSGYTDGVQDSGSTEAYENGFNDGHASGVTDGMNQQKSLMIGAQFNTNGIYRRDNGWNSVYVNVAQTGYTQQDITTAYNSGITEGKKEQKQLLTNTAFTINGDYTNENGWSAITVNVAGGSANLTTLTATTNNTTYTPSTGYDGFSSVHVEVPDTFDSGWTAGYESGWTDGFNSGQTDGYNVGWLDGEQEGFDNGYDSGFTGGYNSGSTDGFSSGYQSGSTDGFESGYQSGSTDGFNEGYTSGYTDGENHQKSLLSAITITENGDYTSENGWSSVTVDVYGAKDLRGMYLTMEVLSGGSLYFNNSVAVARTIQYKINNGSWTNVTASTGGTLISNALVAGDKIYFRGDNPTYGIAGTVHESRYERNYFTHSNGFMFNLYGNMMSLIDSANYASLTSLTEYNTFLGMFSETNVVSTRHLVLPATVLSPKCYSALFFGCVYLTDAPELPATVMTNECYEGMFQGCYSLKIAPELPATTLAYQCYQSMFSVCSGLTHAPELPATNLAESCYSNMFFACRNLMVAPSLPATTLQTGSYYSMFYGCHKLMYIECLATDLSAPYCLNDWATAVNGSGTFVKDANATWTTGNNGIPANWTVQDA